MAGKSRCHDNFSATDVGRLCSRLSTSHGVKRASAEREESFMNYRVVEVKKLAGFLVVGVFSLCLASATMAQRTTGPPPGAGPPLNNNPNLDDRSRQVDENKLRSAEMDVVTEEKNQRLLQAAIANMKEDFSRI